MIRCILVLLLVVVTACHEIFSYSAGEGVDAETDDLAKSDFANNDFASNDADGDLGLDTLPACEPPQGDDILAMHDFEAQSSESKWASVNAGGTYTTQESTVHCGLSAGHVHCDLDTGCHRFFIYELDQPIQTGSVYIRAYFLLPNVQANDRMILLQAAGLNAGESLSAGISEGSLALFDSIMDDRLLTGSEAAPNTWFCLELGVDLSETTGRLRLWHNDNDRPDVDMSIPTKPATGVAKVQLGIGITQDFALEDQAVFFDDAVVSTQRIYCD